MTHPTRRTFVQITAAALTMPVLSIHAASPDWKRQIGLELYTVRDLTAKDYEGTLTKVAEMGYREIEAATDYGKLTPRQFRALLDRLNLSMPSTHVGATPGVLLDYELEGFQLMGLKYAEIRGVTMGSPVTEESVKRMAGQLNANGMLTRKFGMKVLVHNHTQEFQPIPGSQLLPYEILLSETDPSLVAMQLDIGWAAVAGQNILEMFKVSPGRFELWHVKDVTGIKKLSPQLTQTERRSMVKLVPVGEGEIDYKAIFANAGLAGLQHFCIEQDNAADSGDSLAAAQTSFHNLNQLL